MGVTLSMEFIKAQFCVKPAMMKNRNKNFLGLLMFVMILQGCASLPPYEGVVRRAAEVKLYEVENSATDPDKQSSSIKYAGNFAIKREIKLTPEQQKEVKELILMPELYVEPEVKSCLHRGQYAVEFRYRDIVDLTLVLSSSPCSKAYVTTKGGKEELIDLPIESPLEDLIKSIAK